MPGKNQNTIGHPAPDLGHWQVWKCEASGLKGEQSMLVAVKTVKESAEERERKDLVQELKVLKGLGQHPNVLSLLGCCAEKGEILRM